MRYIFFTSALIFLNLNVFGQKIKVTNDFRLVTELETVKSVFNNWDLALGTKYWLEHDASEFGEINIDIGLEYRPFKFLSAGVGYRWTKNRNKYGDLVVKNRLSGDIDLITKLNRFRIDYRICFQNIDEDYSQENVENPASNILRNRLQIKYNIRGSKLEPFALIEHYGQLKKYEKYGVKIKSEFGAAYSVRKHHVVKIYYRIDHELFDEFPYTFYSLGLGYMFKF